MDADPVGVRRGKLLIRVFMEGPSPNPGNQAPKADALGAGVFSSVVPDADCQVSDNLPVSGPVFFFFFSFQVLY